MVNQRISANVPVTIRRNVEDYDDPYIRNESLEDMTECVRCGSVYMSGRWYLKEHVPKDVLKKMEQEDTPETMCPACQKQRDRVPGGILTLSGDFLWAHKDEIMNLIMNESKKAEGINPLERIMGIDTHGDVMELTTTNEKLAQRIGKALHKAYSGDVEYKWSEDNKLARVNWHR